MKTSLVQNVTRSLLGSFLLFAGVGHLTFLRQEFQAQVPHWLPQNNGFIDFVVIASGCVEIIMGLSLLLWIRQKHIVGVAVAIFFILIFPGNIAQYTNHTNAFGLDTDTKRLIRLFFQPVLVLWALWSTGAWKFLFNKQMNNSNNSFYDFQAKLLNRNEISMRDFQGKTIIVVNTASKCGLTPQYEGLEHLYRKYKDQGLVILGFPCNQFAKQESGSSQQIEEFCQLNYGVTFPMFDKIEVNGKNEHPIFSFLKMHLGGFLNDDIKWNFTKFVIDKAGKPVKRFSPITKPEQMEAFIQKIL